MKESGYNINKKNLRSFGLIVGGVFSFISIWPVFWGENLRLWAGVLGVLMILPGLFFPVLLHWPYRIWMTIGHMLGWVNTHLILGIVFLFIITPLGLVKRSFGYNPLGLNYDNSAETYRITGNNKNHNLENQF